MGSEITVGDLKSLNRSVYYHFGHVQEVEVCQESGSNTLFVHAICLSDVKKSSVLDCNSRSYEIDGAKCECAGGKVQKQATHIAALFYWLGTV